MQLQVDRTGLPLLGQFSEEGFVDCVFAIRNLQSDARFYHFHMAASFEDEVVGVDVRVIRGIKAGFDADMALNKAHVYYDGVLFSRSGHESDRLVAALARMYGLTPAGDQMKDVESFTAIALHQGEIDMAVQAVKIKIFGNDAESDDENDYYESFFNLDLPNRLVFWNEKDQDYREPLIRSLSGSGA